MKSDAEIYLEVASGDFSLTQYGPSGNVEAPSGSYAVVLVYLDEDDIRADIEMCGLRTLDLDPEAIAAEFAAKPIYGGTIPEDRVVYALTTMHESGFTYYTLYATEEAAVERYNDLEVVYGEWAEDDDES